MIKRAKEKKTFEKEAYFTTDLESWGHTGKFDIIFSMESLYYSVPMESALKKVYRLLKKQGVFYCGTDFYKDNQLQQDGRKIWQYQWISALSKNGKKCSKKLDFTLEQNMC